MLKKRLIGTITIKNGWAVQSFGYKKILPLGKPECIAENLDRWGVDEILLQVIDRNSQEAGPDFELIHKIANSGISTPLIYAGGIRDVDDATEVIRVGADRLCLDTLLFTNPDNIAAITHRLGAQAVIASVPTSCAEGSLLHFSHHNGHSYPLDTTLKPLLNAKLFSEVMLIDYLHEGHPNSFDFTLLESFKADKTSLILFGGLSTAEQLHTALSHKNVSAVAIGHFLSYKEHAVQQLKMQLPDIALRPAHYQQEGLI